MSVQSRLTFVMVLVSLIAAHEVAAQCSRGGGRGGRGGQGGAAPSAGNTSGLTASFGDTLSRQLGGPSFSPQQQFQAQQQAMATRQQQLIQQQMLQQLSAQQREATLSIRRQNAERLRAERAERLAIRTMTRRTQNFVQESAPTAFIPQTSFATLSGATISDVERGD